MNDSLGQKDLETAHFLYAKIGANKEIFLELLDNILDLITFIPICIDEYGNKDFELYDPSALIIDEIIFLLNDYGFKVSTTIKKSTILLNIKNEL